MSRGLICEQCELSDTEPKKVRNVKLIDDQFLKETAVEEDMVLVTSINDNVSMIQNQLNIRDTKTVKRWMEEELMGIKEPKGYKNLSQFVQSLWNARHSLRI